MADDRDHLQTSRDYARREEIIAVAWRLLHRQLSEPARWLLVDVSAQRLLLIQPNQKMREYPVSTALVGLNATEGSGGTPPGVHTIAHKIGNGAAPGTVFRDRIATGALWPADDPEARTDLILSRILTLTGEEPGLNKGPGCDSFERHIYIHGTNQEDRIGQPVSHGCIRMTNQDVIDLFARVEEGDPLVVI